MANESIRAAFERMWQHTIAKIDEKTANGGGVASWNDLEDRPFYSKVGLVEVLPETAIIHSADNGYVVAALPTSSFIVNETYIVKYNGVEYPCIAAEVEGMIAFGNGAAMDEQYADVSNTDAPFIIVFVPGSGFIVNPLDDNTPSTLAISYNNETIKKLDNKYLDLAWIPENEYTQLAAEKTVTDSIATPTETTGGFHDLTIDMLVNGQSVVVYYDGTPYELIVQKDDTTCFIGNTGLLGGTDTGVPFLLMPTAGRTNVVFTSDNTTSHVMSVFSKAPAKMPEGFLPEHKHSSIMSSEDGWTLDAKGYNVAPSQTGITLHGFSQVCVTDRMLIGDKEVATKEYVDNKAATALILSSPNGTKFSITVGDDGVLTATEMIEGGN